MMTETKTCWYVGKTGNHQGLIIDEDTGTNIAVAYDKANAPLLAAAPELLEALKGLQGALTRMIDKHDPDSIEAEWIGHSHEAILKAEGR